MVTVEGRGRRSGPHVRRHLGNGICVVRAETIWLLLLFSIAGTAADSAFIRGPPDILCTVFTSHATRSCPPALVLHTSRLALVPYAARPAVWEKLGPFQFWAQVQHGGHAELGLNNTG